MTTNGFYLHAHHCFRQEDKREDGPSKSNMGEKNEKEPIKSESENIVQPESNESLASNDTSDTKIEVDSTAVTENLTESDLLDLEKKEVK